MPKIKRINAADAAFQELCALKHNRKKRRKKRAFLVEGVRLINSLLASDWKVLALLYGEGPRSSWAERIIRESPAEQHIQLSDALLSELSSKNKTSELLALAELQSTRLADLRFGDAPLIVLFDRPSNPGNLGTLMRSADAFGADALLVSGHAADPFDPKTLAASAGSFFALPFAQIASPAELTPFLNRLEVRYGEVQIVGSSAHADTPYDAPDYTRPTLLLVGNEEKGLSRFYQALTTVHSTIPMVAKVVTSLNAGVAASIFLAEARRQRNAKLASDG